MLHIQDKGWNFFFIFDRLPIKKYSGDPEIGPPLGLTESDPILDYRNDHPVLVVNILI